MERKHRQRFLEEITKLDAFLSKHKIADLASYLPPDFSFITPQYGEATFTTTTAKAGEILEDFVSFLNRECLKFGSPISIKLWEEDNNRYTFIFTPIKDIPREVVKQAPFEKPYWVVETERFLAHAASRADNYQINS